MLLSRTTKGEGNTYLNFKLFLLSGISNYNNRRLLCVFVFIIKKFVTNNTFMSYQWVVTKLYIFLFHNSQLYPETWFVINIDGVIIRKIIRLYCETIIQ